MKHAVKDSIVTVNYEITDTNGAVLDAGEEPLMYLNGGYDNVFAAIEEGLHGKSVGETVVIKIQPDQMYGEYNADLIVIEPVNALPQPLAIGMQIEIESKTESSEPAFYRVTDIAEGKAVLDGNHPLAGMALVFTGTITDVRPATDDEKEAGQVLRG